MSFVAVLDLRVDATFMGILDPDDDVAASLADLTVEFGASSGLMLVITGGSEDQRRQGAEAAVEALRPLDSVVWAQAEVDPEMLKEFGLVFVADQDFDRLHEGLRTGAPLLSALASEPTLASGLKGLNDTVSESFSARNAPDDAPETIGRLTQALELLEQGTLRPLNDDDLATLADAPEQTTSLGLPVRDGWLASRDGEVYVVDVRTTLDPLRVDIGMDSFAELEESLNPIRAAHPELWMNFSGLLPGGYQDQQNVLGKVLPLSSLSLVLVLLALTSLDRRPTTPLLVGAGLLMALLWTFALVRVVFGYASLTSTAFGVLIFGLGVDYAVHIVVRFNDERADGVPGEEAMTRSLERTL